MGSLIDVLKSNGDFWAILGAAMAFFIAGIGSAKGVGIAGETASGVITEYREIRALHDSRGTSKYPGYLWLCRSFYDIGKSGRIAD